MSAALVNMSAVSLNGASQHVFNTLFDQGHECPKCERACPNPLKDLCITLFQHEMRAAPAWAGAYVW